jgi:hypothetical protein
MGDQIKQHFKTFKNLGYSVAAISHSHYVEYTAYQITGWGGTEANIPLYGDYAYTDKVDDAPDVFLHGSVKWDGCSNWDIDELCRRMSHSCDRQTLVNIGLILAECYDWTKELCEAWCDFEGE